MNTLQQLLHARSVPDQRPNEALPDGTDEASVRGYTLGVLAFYGLHDWSVRFDNAKRRLGVCRYKMKVVGFSRHFLQVASVEKIRQTCLHEVAHALTPGHHHDRVWLRVARQMGYTGGRTCGDVPQAPGRWQATCPGCHATSHRYRALRKPHGWYCRRCGRTRGKLVWIDTMVPSPTPDESGERG